MCEEIKTKKNPDYSASAVNLKNDYRLADLLSRLKTQQEALIKEQIAAQAFIPEEIKEKIMCIELMVKNFGDDIRQTIDEFGSYQDVEAGAYAVKQRKESITYLPEKVKSILPKFAPAVIEESVNKKAFDGLVKGGLITAAEAKECGIVAMSYAYIIKV